MEVHVKITGKDLFDFSMYTSRRGFAGLLNAIITIGSVALLLFEWNTLVFSQRLLLFICALMFTVIQPAMIYRKSMRQAAQSQFSAPIDYVFADDKITVRQNEARAEVAWEQLWEAVSTSSIYMLFSGPRRGFLIPRKSLEGRNEEFVAIVKRNLPGNKTRKLKA